MLIISSIMPFRWLSLNDVELNQGKALVDKNLQELRTLKNNVDTFHSVAISLDNNKLLKKDYYDEKIKYHNEFGREDVNNIENVLQTLYKRDSFFELEQFSLKHQPSLAKEKVVRINFLVNGDKRLEKE